MPLAPGDRLGPYALIAPIGTGGMGEVWKARDTRIDRLVAIKRSTKKFARRFRREARVIAALNHPGICTLYDVGPDYLVMEYIDGTPPSGPLPPGEVIPLAIGIAAALEAAHARGIVHRDLKPANVLVTPSGVKLLDFGLAQFDERSRSLEETASAVTEAGALMGTVAYLSPEQAQGRAVDARSDIFSFGTLLYELLSGRRPFAGASAVDTLAAIVRDEPASLEAPAGLVAIVTRCLRKTPAMRYPSMAAVCTALEALTGEAAGSRQAEPMPSIAVLPFANLSGDKDNEYFADGLAEEVLNSLARIPGLRVIARTSSFAFRDKAQDITAIAATLRVRHVLEGSVRRAGSRIRVTAQLVAADDGSHVWSERYDRELTDVFAIQDDIGEAITGALKVRLAPPVTTVNIEAYQLHLKGRYHLLRLTPESHTKARECFEQALAIDPTSAPAHSALAEYHHSQYIMGLAPADVAVPRARTAAERALAIDPGHGEAHSILASIADTVDYEWQVAETLHHRALAVDPVTSIVRFRYATWHLVPLRRLDEAETHFRAGLETDPLNLLLQHGLVLCYATGRRHRQAIDCAHQAVELDPSRFMSWYALGRAQGGAGDPKAAVASLIRALELAPWSPASLGALAAACHLAGDPDRGATLARSLVPGLAMAEYQAAVGNTDAMFEGLEAAWRQRDDFLPQVGSVAVFDRYLQDPRFQNLLSRMNLPGSSPPLRR